MFGPNVGFRMCKCVGVVIVRGNAVLWVLATPLAGPHACMILVTRVRARTHIHTHTHTHTHTHGRTHTRTHTRMHAHFLKRRSTPVGAVRPRASTGASTPVAILRRSRWVASAPTHAVIHIALLLLYKIKCVCVVVLLLRGRFRGGPGGLLVIYRYYRL